MTEQGVVSYDSNKKWPLPKLEAQARIVELEVLLDSWKDANQLLEARLTEAEQTITRISPCPACR